MIDYGIDIPNYMECLPSTMYVTEPEYGTRVTSWGFEIPPEQMDFEGNFVRPRWFKVLWKADNIKNIDVGDFCLIRHGNWTTSIQANVAGKDITMWYISPKSYKEGVMAVSKEFPSILKEYGYKN